MATTKETAKNAMEELKRVRVQIRLKIHLASMDAKELWGQLEPKLESLESDVEQAGETLADATGKLLTDLGKSIRDLGEKLRDH